MDLGLTVAKGGRLYVSGEIDRVTGETPVHVRTTRADGPADRAHAADLHACAEPFDDPAWLFELKLDAESFGRGMG
jgi:hypothetical protein